jgi:hypothetical protein
MSMTDTGARPLPVEIEEIDKDWLTRALRTRAPGVTVRGFDVVNMHRSTCTKIRLRLDLDEAGKRAGIPQSVILKGGFEPHSRDWHYMHEREVRGYRDVIPVLGLPAPACYFADYDPERRQGIVIMEDLVVRGVTFCQPTQPQTYEQVARRLSVMARHHAQTWASPDFAPGRRWDWAEDVLATNEIYFAGFLEPEPWNRYVTSPRAAAASTRFLDKAWIRSTFGKLLRFSRDLPHVMVHGDTHLGNLYIDRDGTPGFYDSLPGRSPAMEEISYHVTGALDLADRRRWEGSLIQHYLDELARNGVREPPSFDDALHQFGVFLARGFTVFLFNDSYFQPEANNTAYAARFSAAMLDHDTAALLEKIAD